MHQKLIRVLAGEPLHPPPIWMMRQAGRYLPEYRSIREQAGSFLDLCYNPDLASEVTLQPIRRFGFDAAILFSDILVVPHALGQKVRFTEGEGPRLDPVDTYDKFERLRNIHDPAIQLHFEPIYETIRRVRSQLSKETALIGFCGGPWTVASYMLAGRATSDLAAARYVAQSKPQLFQSLIDCLVAVQTYYLINQFRAGVDAVQIFESHARNLPLYANSQIIEKIRLLDTSNEVMLSKHKDALSSWSFGPIARIISGVRAHVPDAKIIVFARGAGFDGHIRVIPETGANAVGVDLDVDLNLFRKSISREIVTQGNLHPDKLIDGGDELLRSVDMVLEATAGLPHIFNLGHGITPQTPVLHVEHMLRRVRR